MGTATGDRAGLGPDASARCYGGLSQENYDGYVLSDTVDLVLLRIKDYYDGLGLVCGDVSRVVLLQQIRLQLNLFCVCFMILDRFEYSLFYYISHYILRYRSV